MLRRQGRGVKGSSDCSKRQGLYMYLWFADRHRMETLHYGKNTRATISRCDVGEDSTRQGVRRTRDVHEESMVVAVCYSLCEVEIQGITRALNTRSGEKPIHRQERLSIYFDLFTAGVGRMIATVSKDNCCARDDHALRAVGAITPSTSEYDCPH